MTGITSEEGTVNCAPSREVYTVDRAHFSEDFQKLPRSVGCINAAMPDQVTGGFTGRLLGRASGSCCGWPRPW